MEGKGIYLKKVDRQAYRRLKALAAERGEPVYEVLNEAIGEYLRSSGGHRAKRDAAVSIEEADDLAYRRAEGDPSLLGRWVGIAGGAVVAIAADQEALVERMREVYAKRGFAHGIVAQIRDKAAGAEEREWLAGSLQQV